MQNSNCYISNLGFVYFKLRNHLGAKKASNFELMFKYLNNASFQKHNGEQIWNEQENKIVIEWEEDKQGHDSDKEKSSFTHFLQILFSI